MAKIIPPLTDSQCKSAKYSITGKNRLFDGGGLYLELRKTGAKLWRMKYRRPGIKKENLLSLGEYPETTLAKARELRAAAQALLGEGIDPALQREIDRVTAAIAAAHSFQALAEEWLATREAHWSEGYMKRMRAALVNDAYPRFGKLPISQITGKIVLDAVRRVERRGALEMAVRLLSSIGMVFRYAVGTGRIHADVTYGLEKFLSPRPPAQHFPHVSEESLPQLLLLIENYHGRPETRLALKIMMRTFPRTNELRWAEWPEWDFENGLWDIPPERMKGTIIQKRIGTAHLVPLSKQTIEIGRELQRYTGHHRFMFPGIRRPSQIPISAETINKALKIMGFGGEQTGHGFRGLASTIMNERSGFRPEVIESQLAHKDKDKVRRAYNHAIYLDERRALMQWWSDYLDDQLSRAKPIPPTQ